MLAEDLELQRALALRAVTGGLLRLRWLAAATRFELAMHRHMRALKYGYNPDQPHWDINSWYGTPGPEFEGQSPRDYLSGRNWDVRMQVGLEALRQNGVLKR